MLKLIILSFLIYSLQAQAQNTPSSARLISPFQRVQPDSRIEIGVYITLQKGWHTYWQNPGDIGQSLKWTAPASLSMSPLMWPLPQRMQTQKWTSFIHKNNALIKRSLHIPKNAQNKFSVSSKISWIICKTICRPMKQDVHLDLLIGAPAANPNSQKIFQKFIYPQPLNLIEAEAKQNALSLQSPENFELIDFFPIHNLSHEAPIIEKIHSSSYKISFSKKENLKNAKALAVLKRGGKIQTSEIHLSDKAGSLLLILAMAFLGGLILNFMPCVLPVVFLKFYHTASIPRRKLIGSSLSYGAGVIFSFLALAFFIQLLKTGGQAAGWGFQMESPLFVSSLILLFALVSLNFLDLFSVPVFLKRPQASGGAPIESFLSGLLITAAASPCTAPFMGAAVGYAFSRSMLEILFVFFSLGLGMSSPYLFLCFFPKLLKYFPHPGSWSRKLKKAMAAPMAAAAVWLFSILFHLAGLHLTVLFGSAVFILTLALWLKKHQHIKKWAFRGLIGWSALLITYGHTSFYFQNISDQAQSSFSIARLNQLRETQAVLLYFTAPWCLSCQVNEWTTLKDQKVLDFLQQNEILLMKINWSPGSKDISQIFEKHKRAGIPFTLFFPLGKRPEVILPEILTPRLLLNILKKNQSVKNKASSRESSSRKSFLRKSSVCLMSV